MYEVVDSTAKEIVLIYIIFLSACLLTYPIINLIVNAVGRGANKWR